VDTDDRIVVDVDGASVGVHRVRDLVDVVLRGQPRPDVDELADARFAREMADGVAEELPVQLHAFARFGERLDDLLGGLAVRREVVLSAEHEVVDACDVRRGDVDTRGRILCHRAIANLPLEVAWFCPKVRRTGISGAKT
jgi:hypothetical protein